MAVELRPVVAVLALSAVLVVGLSGSVIFTDVAGEEFDNEFATIDIAGEERDLWLYTSTARSFDSPTLAINVVAHADADEVRQLLVNVGEWEETAEEEQDIQPDESTEILNATFAQWEHADGANRYAFLVGEGGSGGWLTEAYQIHHGTYFGSRHHIRAFAPDEGGDWTAIQAHHEHWDWFTGRHSVTSVRESQRFLEEEFIDTFGADTVVRTHVGERDRSDFDGWLTVVDLVSNGTAVGTVIGVLLLGATVRRLEALDIDDLLRPQEVRTALLAGAIVAIVLFVRFAGIALERHTGVPIKLIPVLLYPILFAGLPIATYLLARQLDRPWAFTAGAAGFAVAVILDYSYLGVTVVPLDVLVHRAGLAVALGLLAAGASRTARHTSRSVDHVQLGVLLWLVGMVLPMLRHTPLPV